MLAGLTTWFGERPARSCYHDGMERHAAAHLSDEPETPADVPRVLIPAGWERNGLKFKTMRPAVSLDCSVVTSRQ